MLKRFFKGLYYIGRYYPQIFWCCLAKEGAFVFPYLFFNWHHRTLYFASKYYFIKVYLDVGRGCNERGIHQFLEKNNFLHTTQLVRFADVSFGEILMFNYISLERVDCPEVALKFDRTLLDLGVQHGDLAKNIFSSNGNLYVIDFAFSKINGNFLCDGILDEYISERAVNYNKKVVIFGSGSPLLSDIMKTCTIDDFHYIHFDRSLTQRIILNFAALFSPNIFTMYLIRKYNLGLYKSDTLIFFDFPLAYKFNTLMIKSSFNKFILYYWNPIKDSKRLLAEKEVYDEIWSYSEVDCKQYGLRYNGQFYKVRKDNSEKLAHFDLFYVGSIKKDRQHQLARYIRYCESLGLNNKIILTGDTDDSFLSTYVSKSISYESVVNYVKNSKCLLDINSSSVGMTIRPLEALYFNKKLITNKNDIYTYEGFNFENTLKLEERMISNTQGFLDFENPQKPYSDYNERYSVNRFVSEFIYDCE
jgi:tRNA A-37 threonylcarbamoyl transferase component Bud32